ncbi:PREDICTED: cell migration-inducing and hyaluronan-binding protein isoform X1 [Corvus brachyrhynchos]|uniref:cell migration-inducing and hyaluronan-binding protein isoform X1 n=1 Tax=Corvus brachyrhynchos TaxID=85066 RepID=UPI0004DDE10A|nr:PREDICTED: cell migration-inducing and hyaluronan-binding protein isoform X1 [Corvus brachyrhynchos]XP_017598125.1 PREDICTED: cell migration-inducing and hyaluronan-binding protein isoform X1 [Corvus brachyrhynchos]XP_017598126.1 PREDICTED: cell migration-inducing and hyaluronan-binding protein isoform X1 [Corvus brachyrhynchos]
MALPTSKYLAGSLGFFLFVVSSVSTAEAAVTCPDRDPELEIWNPGHNKENRVEIRSGRKLLLSSSATVHSIHITDGGKLVIKDDVQPIILRTRHILIENDGELHIGSELCPYQANVVIILYGRADDGSQPNPYFGQKYLGVSKGGTLEIHGKKKLSWTFLNKTLHPGGMEEGGYYFERSWGHRGVIVHVIDPKTGAVVHSDRFDTYRAKEESIRLAQYLGTVANGMILSVAVNDEGSRNLDDLARKAMTRLGSKHFLHLGFRHPWSFITIKGNPSSSVEDHIEYQGHKGSAVAKVFKLFKAENGEHFNVSSTSEWVQDVEWTEWFEKPDKARSKDMEKLSDFKAAHPDKICRQPIDIQAMTLDGVNLTTEVFYKSGHDYQFLCHGKDQTGEGCRNYRVRFLCGKSVKPKLTVTIDTNVNSTILNLVDDVSSWKPGDRLVVASTDYSMYQAEEFQVLPCRTCRPTQVKVAGKATYLHMGEVVDGVDMRAEVGLLSRNIVVMGEMEQQCYEYSSKLCSFFDFDTFGGHIKIGLDFKATHIEGLELKYMGQQTMGHYPIHFHMAGDVDEKGGYNPPTYVKDTSIHNTFSRCVTVHGSNGLLVKDVVGYDALGHCFFTEDGPEERNTFDHCLGLLVKPSTLLPSDRDSRMCKLITEGAYPGYIPKPRQDCSAVSTFWIANPHNNLINCAAAGSEETGFWFVLHHVPTGPSAGMYSPGYSEHMPMGRFSNNRAHSNYRAGMIIDNGVKTTPASAKDKRPILTLISGRYSPHKDADPLKPREPAIIERFIAYKNQDHGAWLRGGDVWLDNCQFADNGIGLTLASGGTFPHDDGSKQEIKNSLFVGESGNLGTETIDNEIWGPGGLDHRGRTLPIGPDFPIRGIQFYDGPINVQNCTFRKFAALDGRHTSALAFRLNNAWQSCPNNNVTGIHFEDVPITSRVFFGEPGPWFNDLDMDGDKTSVFHDVDGSVSEYPGSYLIKEDNWLIKHPDCIDVPDWRGSICSGHFAQIYIQAYKPANLKMKIIKNDYHNHPLYLEGALSKSTHYQQYQPVITLRKGYTIHWDKTAPEELAIWLINFNKNDWIQVGFCYPKGTTFSILSDIHNRLLKKTYKTGTFYRTSQMEKLEHRYPTKGYYYWDEDTGLLFLKLKAQNEKEKFAFCSVKGCERIRIKAVIPKTAGVSDCEATAYPKYIETPIVEVPMPKKLSSAQLKTKDHLIEVKIETYKKQYFHLKDDFAYIEVDGVRFFLTDEGIQLVVIDGHHGKVVDRVTFKNSILQGIPAQIENYVNNIKDHSIVLVTSKGRLISRGPWTKILEKLGAGEGFRLKEKMAFVGFKGSFRPVWVKLVTNEESAKIYQALPIPVVKKMKL